MSITALVKKDTAVALRRTQIDRLAKAMVAEFGTEDSDKEIDESTKHHFCEGVYAREYNLPKGHVVIGRVHKGACFNVMLKGRMKIVSSQTEARDVEAPQFFVSKAGDQKALYAYEDVTFITFHATEETTPEDMAELLSVETVEDYAQYEQDRLTHQEKDT